MYLSTTHGQLECNQQLMAYYDKVVILTKISKFIICTPFENLKSKLTADLIISAALIHVEWCYTCWCYKAHQIRQWVVEEHIFCIVNRLFICLTVVSKLLKTKLKRIKPPVLTKLLGLLFSWALNKIDMYRLSYLLFLVFLFS